jgi:arylsulfatase A-like enzyme
VNRGNSSVQTPNIDALAQRGTNFRQAVCNQPLCSPSRASFLTSRYATETGVWKLELELNHSLPTIATTLRQGGYETAFIGKWHVAANFTLDNKPQLGWIPPGPSRGGFDDHWEGSNIPELVSYPYEGSYWDNEGKNIGFKNQYRVDFLTDRAVRYIKGRHDKPWLLFLSQLEPHHQNNVDQFVPPNRYIDSYKNPFVPQDLRDLPGNWGSHLPGYYGCVQAIDDCVGKLIAALNETGQLDNTIVVFFSDHGCTFRTRLGEYKRSPHDSSLRVPLIVAGPGFDQSQIVDELVSLLDLTPTLIDGAGVDVPLSMKGRSLKPLVSEAAVRKSWDCTAYIQLSQAICGRAIRTKEWIYAAYDPSVPEGNAPFSKNYTDFALYSLTGDPYQKVNLIGRPEYKKICNTLRKNLIALIVANGEPEPTINPALFYA